MRMSENSELKKLLLDDGLVVFNNLKNNLGRALSAIQPLPVLQLRYVDGVEFNASVYHPGGNKKRAIVRMSEAIPLGIHSSINKYSSQFINAIVGDNNKRVDSGVLLTNVYDIAIYFIFLHEFYHVFGGHLDYRNATFNMAYYAENQRFLSNIDKRMDPEIAFFLELEADNNALYSVLNHLNMESVFQLAGYYGEVGSGIASVHQLEDKPRTFAFRLILSAKN